MTHVQKLSLLSAYISVHKFDATFLSKTYFNSETSLDVTTIWKYLVTILLETITHLTLNMGEFAFVIKNTF